MAARRYNRRRKKRRGGGFILSLLTFCVVIAAIVMSVTVFLKVATIEVSGLTKYEPSDIIATSEISLGDNMFMVNKFEVANRILETYPYIEQIKIRRRLPDTFTFEITERTPAAYIECDGSLWLIDKKGYLLEAVSELGDLKIPKISGAMVLNPNAGDELVLENAEQLVPLKELLSSIETSGMSDKIVRIEIEKLYAVNLVYGDRFMVNLGDTSEIPRKIEMLRAVIEQLTEFDKGTINVSAIKEARFRPDAAVDLREEVEKEKDVTPVEEPVENGETSSEETEDNSEIPPE